MQTPIVSDEEQAAAFLAWKRGEKVQVFSKINERWLDLPPERGYVLWNENIIRRNPSPKLRPWKADEVPVGAVIRMKGLTAKMLLTEYNGTGYCFFGAGPHIQAYTPSRMLNECDHSTDGGRTWLPCGVMEEQS